MISFQIRDFHIAKWEEDIGFYAGYVGELFYVFLLCLINDTWYGVLFWYKCPHLTKCRLAPLQLCKNILPRALQHCKGTVQGFYTADLRLYTLMKLKKIINIYVCNISNSSRSHPDKPLNTLMKLKGLHTCLAEL